MPLIGWLIGFPLFIVAPGAIAVWLGSRVHRPLFAFALTWLATPIASLLITLVFWPVMRALTPPNNDGTGAIMIPFFGIVTGFGFGIASAMIVRRRRDKGTAASGALDQKASTVAKL
jgi:hypothetical protein